ncbi:MAG: zinc-ribbon domain-containing protein [Oscillospiraceae bacterium]|nr:zinc-ribbon domain-containing protein [Oscillospiraceae bacterium]
MFCRKCGRELNEEAVFCPGCGTRTPMGETAAPEGAAQPVGAASVGSAQAQPTQAPVQPTQAPVQPTQAPVQPVQAPAQPMQAPAQPMQAPSFVSEGKAPRRKKKTWLVILIVLLALLLLGGAAVGFFCWKNSSWGGKDSGPAPETAPLFYLTEAGELKYHAPGEKKPILLADGYSTEEYNVYTAVYGTGASDDGKTIAYIKNYQTEYDQINQMNIQSGELFVRRAQGGDEDVSVARSVQQFILSGDGKVIWYVATNGLYAYDVKKELIFPLDSQSGTLIANYGSKRLLYSKMRQEDENYFLDYYIADMTGKEPEKRKLDADIMSVNSHSEDLTRFIYTRYRYDSAADVGITDVYSMDQDGEKKKLLSGDLILYYCDADTGELVYTQRRDSGVTSGEYILDDMNDVDAGWEEPKTEDYQVSHQGVFGSYTTTDYEAYYAAREEYEQKLFRDTLRETIEANDAPIYVNDLIRQVGDEKTVLAEGIDHCLFYDGERQWVAYRKPDMNDIEPVAMISQLTSVDEVYDFMIQAQYQRPAEVCALTVAGGAVDLFQSTGDSYEEIQLTDEGFYILQSSYVEDGRQTAFWYVPVTGTAVGQAERIDGEAWSIVYGKICGQVAYRQAREDSASSYRYDLYLLRGTEKSLMAEGVTEDGIIRSIGDEACYFTTEYDWERQYGELYRYDGKSEPQWIASDVNSVWARSASQAYLLKDYSGRRGDLYLYDKGELKAVDYDVMAVSSANFAQ